MILFPVVSGNVGNDRQMFANMLTLKQLRRAKLKKNLNTRMFVINCQNNCNEKKSIIGLVTR